MTVRVAIRGFGRTGRRTLRSACPDVDEAKGILAHSEDPIVASDTVGPPYSAIVR
jgi:glyceraldehyde-3-phosphate dehydrogenase/erythrose-4-phosphate dehydrogenase